MMVLPDDVDELDPAVRPCNLIDLIRRQYPEIICQRESCKAVRHCVCGSLQMMLRQAVPSWAASAVTAAQTRPAR